MRMTYFILSRGGGIVNGLKSFSRENEALISGVDNFVEALSRNIIYTAEAIK